LSALLFWINLRLDEPVSDLRFLLAALPWMLIALLASYAAARWISTDAGSYVLLVAAVAIITISDAPARIALGPALIAYSIPIMAAGMLLPPWSTFILAGLSSVAVYLVSIQSSSVLLGVPATLIFVVLALITWYFAASLHNSNRTLNQVNAALAADVAQREEAEARLRLLSHIVEQSPIAIVLMSQEGCFEYVNPRFTELTGFTLDEISVGGWEALRPADVPPDVNEQILASMAAGKPWRTQNKRMRKDGSWFWEEVFISVVRDADAGTLHYLAIAEDVTVRKQAEDTLRNLNAELERRVEARTAELLRANVELQHGSRIKDEFLATMSHELRTPLTGVLGAADVLGEQLHGALNAKQQESVRMIRESGKHLLALINGILDLSKIEAGGMELNPDTVNVDEVCSAALAVVRNEAHHKHLALSYSSTPPLLTLLVDPVRLKQILVNLLSNAVKFTPAGGSIGLDVAGDAANEEVQFTVWDTGIGIAPEQQGRLFQPFVQIDSGLDRHYSGTGLGLTLVRKFAELHGGGVAVDSSPGVGSRFTVTLPWRATVSAVEREPAHAVPSAGEHLLGQVLVSLGRKPLILLAEDNRTSIEIVLNYLEPLGCELLVVLRGDDAVRMTIERQPDVVLMDIQMPHMDGIEAMRQIRRHPAPQIARTPILALTALAMRGDRERCLAAGADDYLSKPFTMRALAEAIHRLILGG
jgi:PAS domain S-box-containing protein